MTGTAEQKSFTTADETREFEHGRLDMLQIGGAEIGRLTLQPGWRWSKHVKPKRPWTSSQLEVQGRPRLKLAAVPRAEDDLGHRVGAQAELARDFLGPLALLVV